MKATIATMIMAGGGIRTVYGIVRCKVNQQGTKGEHVNMNAKTTEFIAHVAKTEPPGHGYEALKAYYLELAKPYGTPEYPAYVLGGLP